MTIGERIKILRKELKLNQTAFGKACGIKQTTVAGYESGFRIPLDVIISSICREFNVNENWLRTGEGEMLKKEELVSLDDFLKKQEATELEIEIIKALFSLNKNTRNELINTLKTVFNNNSKIINKSIKSVSNTDNKEEPRIIRVPARGGYYDIQETEEQRKALEKDLKMKHEYNPKDF